MTYFPFSTRSKAPYGVTRPECADENIKKSMYFIEWRNISQEMPIVWIPKSALWWYNSNVEKVWLAFVLNYAPVTYLVQSRACLYIDHPIKYRKIWHTYLMFGTCPSYFIHLIRQEPEYNNVRIYFVPPLCLIKGTSIKQKFVFIRYITGRAELNIGHCDTQNRAGACHVQLYRDWTLSCEIITKPHLVCGANGDH